MKHEGFTPGKWEVESPTFDPDGTRSRYVGTMDRSVALVCGDSKKSLFAECDANAALIADAPSLLAENESIKAVQAKVTADYAACFAENERLRALLAEIDTWFVSTPDAGALSSSEHFKVGCANDLFSTISEIRAALAAKKG